MLTKYIYNKYLTNILNNTKSNVRQKVKNNNHLKTEQVSNENIFLKDKTNSHWEWTQLALRATLTFSSYLLHEEMTR
jgi:hypothetical protein